MYDLVAGQKLLKSSYILSKSKALELFPMLKSNQLKGAIVYYDGQHDDARMCLALALTAARYGANVANHTEVIKLVKRKQGDKEVMAGAIVKDNITGKQFEIKAKCVVNATGPYTDFIRQLDDKQASKICQPSSVRRTWVSWIQPHRTEELFSSYPGSTLQWRACTTDIPCEVTDHPSPTEAEVQFILHEIKNYLNPDINVRRGDVLSAWSGIRPLVLDPNAKNTQSVARNHIIDVSDTNLVTIAGGKWTTYRHMAEETVNKCVEVCQLTTQNGCLTKGLLLDGAHKWTPTLFIRLIQDYGLDNDVAQHLARTYGDHSFSVAKLAQPTGKRWPVVGRRLHQDYPYIEAEVKYAVKEYAERALDVIARRTRLSFLNVQAAEEVLPRVVEIMSVELNWSKQRQEEELKRAKDFLSKEMGLNLKTELEKAQLQFTTEEVSFYTNKFKVLDADNKGYITVNDLRNHFKLMSIMRHGSIAAKKRESDDDKVLKPISIARSGGGV
ncbi:hypothetical protein HELRODRAFT_161330 [Helobdella robusta]|uniref:glycerol-3-phosphate dehydrogenase n=1 Tax=Helobdella robusta TaxID=6412 RepID=T1ERC6_HELRO|nr:hypothetical protein HELRODRAFT_161330 [Helobdella robusta]ESO02098.1 hypothetical protein HELRODRAFT_161330 [Helobdella robusta]